MTRRKARYWPDDVARPRFAQIVMGAALVVGGTLLPFAQSVFNPGLGLPLFEQEQNDWTMRFQFGFFSLRTLTHYPGLIIAIVACLTIVLDVRVQCRSAEIRRNDRSWGLTVLAPELVAVIAMALLVLFSWPVTGQSFEMHSQGISSGNSITSQLVVLRGPGAVVSFLGIAMCLFVLTAHLVDLWAFRPHRHRRLAGNALT